MEFMSYIKGKRDGRIEAGLCSDLQAMGTPVIVPHGLYKL